MISFDDVVRVLLKHVPRGRHELVDDARVDRCPIASDLDRVRSESQRPGEESLAQPQSRRLLTRTSITWPCWSTARYTIGPSTGDLDVGLVDEPPVAAGVPGRAGGVDEFRCEGLHPALDRHVVDLNPAFGEQFLHIAVGQAVSQIPAHRDRDDLTRKPIAGRSDGRTESELITRSVCRAQRRIDQRNSARTARVEEADR